VRYFDFLDLVVTYGPELTRRDVTRIGVHLQLPEFATFNLPETWGPRPYEERGKLLLERFTLEQVGWFTNRHLRCLKDLLARFVDRPELDNVSFGVACYFLLLADDQLRFHSKWRSPLHHDCGLRRADFLRAYESLIVQGVIKSCDRASSRYKFFGVCCPHLAKVFR
jgi:hypothetical protein